MKLGDLDPIEAALSAFREREAAAFSTHGEDDLVGLAWREARLRLEKAIAEAANPHLADGVSVREYAMMEGITRAAAYKRIERQKAPAKRVPGRGLVILLAS